MVERAMKHANIEYVRIDGKVPSSTRNRLLDQYRHDPDVKVMLITTSCGAVGYVKPVQARYFDLT
jgi:SNF2 family DNA or RNA helicase